jgi:hypothetical protein
VVAARGKETTLKHTSLSIVLFTAATSAQGSFSRTRPAGGVSVASELLPNEQCVMTTVAHPPSRVPVFVRYRVSTISSLHAASTPFTCRQ